MITWYRETIEETGRSGVLWMLIAFVITFAITRLITRHIRSKSGEAGGDPEAGPEEKGLVGDIHIGGVHIHHQVWGILLILVSAVLEFAYQPDTPWLEVLGALFGVGAALTLDEFALWVHLDDVYWSEEGRKSIDAIVVAACIGGVLLIGTAPFGVDDNVSQDGLATVAITVLITIGLALIAVLKGKLAFGLIGLFFTPFALVGAIRLAKPGSPWARRRYRDRPKKLAKSQLRYGERRQARIDRLRDLLGGAHGSAEG
jgi:hypothetical protein